MGGSLPWRFPSECPLGMLPLPHPRRMHSPSPAQELLPEYLSLCLFFAGDAPFCTPEQHKECAEPALGQYWGTNGVGGGAEIETSEAFWVWEKWGRRENGGGGEADRTGHCRDSRGRWRGQRTEGWGGNGCKGAGGRMRADQALRERNGVERCG